MAFKLGSPIVSGGVFQANTNQQAIKRGTDVIAEGGERGGESALSQFQSKPQTTQLLPYTRARSKVQFRKCQLSGFGG